MEGARPGRFHTSTNTPANMRATRVQAYRKKRNRSGGLFHAANATKSAATSAASHTPNRTPCDSRIPATNATAGARRGSLTPGSCREAGKLSLKYPPGVVHYDYEAKNVCAH